MIGSTGIAEWLKLLDGSSNNTFGRQRRSD
jgi:hypothetical protein